MFKKILNFLFNVIILACLIGIIYYFYTSNNSASLLKNGSLSYLEDNTIENVNSDDNAISYYNLYYYNQLDDNAKIIYSALYNNVEHLKEDNFEINFSTKFNDLLNKSNGKSSLDSSFQSALDAFFYDHPDLFYLDISKMSLLTNSVSFLGKTTYKVSIKPSNGINYLSDGFSSKAQVELAIQEVENLKNKIISNISGNDYNKALIIHDTLVDLIEYDKSVSRKNTYNIYGALVEHNVVCEGYAKTFKYLMDSLDIPCILVSGLATNSTGKTEAHMWNYIQLDGNWYGVDLTWDDPIIIGGHSKNTIRRTYFCKGINAFYDSHCPDSKFSSGGMSFNYPNLSQKNYK